VRGGTRAQRRAVLCARAVWAGLLFGGRRGLSGMLASIGGLDGTSSREITSLHSGPVVADGTAATARGC